MAETDDFTVTYGFNSAILETQASALKWQQESFQ